MTQISFGYENPLKVKFGETFFKDLPNVPGVYFFLNEKCAPLYIGKADNLHKRLMSYQAAKPGTMPEHILEMLELASDIRWEQHESGAAALTRESELIQIVRPPYNIAGTDPISYLFLGTRIGEIKTSETVSVDFRLSRMKIKEGFSNYGCFRPRGKVKAGYSALLRLFYASLCPRERFHLPAKLCRTSPSYVYKIDLQHTWLEPLDAFLKGESLELLHLLLKTLLQKENLPKELYLPLQRDLQIAKDFFHLGAQETAGLIKSAGVKSSSISKKQMDRILNASLPKHDP